MNIQDIMATDRNVADVIADLKKKSITVPAWSDLKKEYDPMLHPVMTDRVNYPDKTVRGKTERMTRITLAWQRLATNRMAELLFGIPVKRVYNPQTDEEKKVVGIMEDVFRRNRIDSQNIERAKQLYASCEFITLWYGQKVDSVTYGGEKTVLKLRCKTYSPMTGATLYPLFDDYDDLVALSVEYGRNENNTTINYFETYTDTEHVRWKQDGKGWIEDLREQIKIGKIGGVYAFRKTPVWENESDNVYEAEWALSRNGNYLRKNARPNWVVYSDEKVTGGASINKDNDGVAFLQYPANAKAGYETWNQAYDALKFHVEKLEQNFNKMIQQPDISYENMKSTPMSGESRKMMFIDAQQKVHDESGIWLEALDREVQVVKAYLKVMYSSLSAAIDSLQVEVQITPFTINDEAEQIQNLSNATGGKQIMSQRTAIQNLGYVDDVEKELELINNESTVDVFQEPTE